MKFVDGVEVVEVCDIRGVLDCCDCVSVHVFDVECGCFDFVTGVYVDGDGDLILEIGGDGQFFYFFFIWESKVYIGLQMICGFVDVVGYFMRGVFYG